MILILILSFEFFFKIKYLKSRDASVFKASSPFSKLRLEHNICQLTLDEQKDFFRGQTFISLKIENKRLRKKNL